MATLYRQQQPSEPSRSSTTHALLQLDCSADLLLYSRNLGPGVQARCFERKNEALRAQLDQHRDFLIQQKIHSPVPRLDIPRQDDTQRLNAHSVASQLIPLHVITQPRHQPEIQIPIRQQPAMNVLVRPQSPVEDDMDVHPVALPQAFEPFDPVLEERRRYEDMLIHHRLYERRVQYLRNLSGGQLEGDGNIGF
ncbi:hypothetical protein P153DRAFT_381501 [Dothidotthia symphoricarpi CBS 119687]|uniref:Uncharacterized protein n=1 Tax=Dothidotthia symphoricarpi CBS 119687 TaxID=1392245 RepID=A0A6A6AR81_9PLEO|nr:uncharacterized protein P153DRAFT_381501 [Dothidotthia symphoricarpi CBS 119687]KAF2134320.1 hypothetical protein P153DRAFT_381501 [Dothidotthia symphoricarpi CBS 119687]